MSQSTPYNNGKSRKYIIFLGGGAQIFLVEKIYFGIHFQFLSLQSKTNVLSVGNKNCKRQHASYKLEMDQNFEPRDYSKSTANQVSMRVTEGREKSSKCNQCAYASYHAGKLRIHLKIHTGEKTNKCNQCDYACSDPSTLRRHLITHSGEKPNKCNQCDYASFQAGSLRRHLVTHGEEK